ncbi:MAG: hypothetical protein FJ225_11605 [Lentisphaerae bacterium]|nr:hypothetical protein [Lentisphaerota bacterium]
MIWDAHRWGGDGRDGRDARVRAAVRALCGAPGGAGAAAADDLARAVADYVLREAAAAEPGAGELAALASRALHGLGEGRAARRVLLEGTGMARPAAWDVTGGGAMWILDLRRVLAREDAALEMILFAALGTAVDALAECWDATGGRGVLGLRHVPAAAARLLGRGRGDGAVGRLVGEALRLCGARLARAGRARGWSETPLVMNLDL